MIDEHESQPQNRVFSVKRLSLILSGGCN